VSKAEGQRRDDSAEDRISQFVQKGLPELASALKGTDISELEISVGDVRLAIKRETRVLEVTAPPAGSPRGEMAPPRLVEPPTLSLDHRKLVTSPMVGVFHSRSKADSPPYIHEGDYVENGQTIGVIEAMKMMNEIESDHAGRVVEVLVSDGQAVEFGQPLVVLDSSSPADVSDSGL
jgi:acetyl-CoA carboxylase biotin carboxyl carrier protein